MATRSFLQMPTASSLVSAYASLSTTIVLLRTFFDQFVPRQLREYIIDFIRSYWKPKSSKLTLIFEEKDGMSPNQMFDAAEAFLFTRIKPDSDFLRITKNSKEPHINVKFANTEEIVDTFEGILVAWNYVIKQTKQNADGRFYPETKLIRLIFEKKHKETIINSYLPWVIKRSQELENEKKVVKIHDLDWYGRMLCDSPNKESLKLDHPSTFHTLAMDTKMKQAIIDDLDLFLKRRDFYKKVGKAWKRGYLLYGPPGTGKSSLIAAMANYLKFDIYDLQLTNIERDSNLRKLILSTKNRSILVIEDLDCTIKLPDRNGISASNSYDHKRDNQFSLSGLLNFIDGLWSCCGDERIIIFTTNHKERLDPALLRPGRMDVHIHMSYLTFDGFKTLAANYLNIYDDHGRFKEIEELINETNLTPAEVAEELMKSDNLEVVLEGVVNYLKLKKTEQERTVEGTHDKEDEVHGAKEEKIIS